MSKAFLMLAALSVSATAAFARMGEDLKQSIARYGNPIGNDEIRHTVSFSKDGFFIVCHFQDRICDSIIFSHVDPDNGGVIPLTPEQITALLAANGGGRHWQAADPENYTTDDGSLYAHYDREARVLVFATKAYKDSQEAPPQPTATPGM